MDPLMQLLLETANQQFGAPPVLPLSLQGNPLREATKRRADFLKLIDQLITADAREVQKQVPEADYTRQCPMFATRLRANKELEQRTALFLDDVPDFDTRISISLRLYAGYLDTAKVIAWGVTGRKNTASTRYQEVQIVEARAAADTLYRAGVETAPQYKWRVLAEGIYSEGIPTGSIVLLDWEDCRPMNNSDKVYSEASQWIRTTNAIVWQMASVFLPISVGGLALAINAHSRSIRGILAVGSLFLFGFWVTSTIIYSRRLTIHARRALWEIEKKWQLDAPLEFYTNQGRPGYSIFGLLWLQGVSLLILLILWPIVIWCL